MFDPTDTEPPLVEITGPANGTIVTYLTGIVGTVADDNLEFYRLQYALAGTGEFTTFFELTQKVSGTFVVDWAQFQGAEKGDAPQ